MNKLASAAAILLCSTPGAASDLTVEMHVATVNGPGEKAGTVVISDRGAGAVFTLNLSGMAPLSMHGFHVHENGDCGPGEKGGKIVPALAAGGHWDPANTGRHEGWQGQGHLGDLPRLEADAEGKAYGAVPVPRITDIGLLKGHALMVHAGGDNYADMPKKLGGGGARMFCGVIE